MLNCESNLPTVPTVSMDPDSNTCLSTASASSAAASPASFLQQIVKSQTVWNLSKTRVDNFILLLLQQTWKNLHLFGIKTAPAWPPLPSNSTLMLAGAAIAVTIPIEKPGPKAKWSSDVEW